MFCPQCGTENPPDAKFCMRDGAALAIVTPRGSAIPTAASTRDRGRPSAGISLARVPKLPLLGAAAAVLVLIGAFQGFTVWQAGQQRDAYTRGVQAYGDRDYETAVDMFKQSGDYLDARSRLDDSQKKVGQALPHYDKGVQSLQKGLTWDAAYELRQVLDVDPKFRDASQQLLQARTRLGRLLWFTPASGSGNGSGGSGSLWSAPADGGDAKEVGSGSLQSIVRAFPSTGQIAFAITSGGRQTLYVSDSDGGNRKEVVTADSIDEVRTGVQPDYAEYQALDLAPGKQFLAVASSAATPSSGSGAQRIAPTTHTLYLVDLPSGARKELYSIVDQSVDIADVTADLSQVLVHSRAITNGQFAPATVTLVDTASGARKELASGTNASARMSPNGAAILTTYAEQDNRGNSTTHAALLRPADDLTVDLGTADGLYGSFSDDSRLLGLIVNPKNSSVQTFRVVDAQTGGSADVLQGQVDRWLRTAEGKLFVDVREGTGNQARSVVYQADENGQNRLEIAAGDGTSIHLVGKRVLIAVQEKNRSAQTLFLLNGDGTGHLDLGSASDFSGTTPSPDASHMAIVIGDSTRGQSSANRLLIFDLKSAASAPVEVAAAPRIIFGGWSPDGSRVAFLQPAGTATSNSNVTGGMFIGDASGSAKPVRLLDGVSFLFGWPPFTVANSKT